MPQGPQNPYASPPQLEERRASLSERLTCPACRGHQVSFAKAYWWYAFYPFRCPRCGVLLRIAKTGLGRWSSFALALPSGMLAGAIVVLSRDAELRLELGHWGDFLTPLTLAVLLATSLTLDFFVDQRFVYLRLRSEPAQDPGTEEPVPRRGEHES